MTAEERKIGVRSRNREKQRRRRGRKKACEIAAGFPQHTQPGTYVKIGMTDEERSRATKARARAKYERKKIRDAAAKLAGTFKPIRDYQKRKKYLREWRVNKLKNDAGFKLSILYRIRIQTALKYRLLHKMKRARSSTLLGCTFVEFKEYIEKQFTDGMTWEAFLKGEIELDHKIPVYAFDLRRPDEVARCFHYTNHQPLWRTENRQKSKKMARHRQIPLFKIAFMWLLFKVSRC